MGPWEAGITVIAAVLLVGVQSGHAEFEQTTFEGDLLSDPVAQDILQKIEMTKKWIAQIDARAADQAELEQKRQEVTRILQDDLEEWERLWEQFTFDYRFSRMAEHVNEHGGSVLWESYSYTNSKIQAGRAALQKVLDGGGGPEEAMAAYAEAAKMPRSELFAVNALANVKYGLAYYNQQILFDDRGQFHDAKSGDALRQYYLDYRTIPAYLSANPKDLSWRDIGKTDADTECRAGNVLVYRPHADDYVCTTEATAEMWERHAVGSTAIELSDKTPIEVAKLKQDAVDAKIKSAKYKLESIYAAHDSKLKDLDKRFEQLRLDMAAEMREEERSMIEGTHDRSKRYVSAHLEDIREKYRHMESKTDMDRQKMTDLLQESLVKSIEELIDIYAGDPDLRIAWSPDDSAYRVVAQHDLV